MNYRYKENSGIDAYGDTQNIIHFKWGDMRKQYNFTQEFREKHPKFCAEFAKYWECKESLFTDPLVIVNYIDWFNLPVRLYSNFVDEEFADIDAAKEYLNNEYMGQDHDKLFKYEHGWVGLDGEVTKND